MDRLSLKNNNRLIPVIDKLAEDLENAGLYRRAATRWLDVFFECLDDSERAWVARRRLKCLNRPHVFKANDSFPDIYRAVSALHSSMGLDHPAGVAFRNYRTGKRRHR
ncbi:PerC family transcriptional regulator [Klebsiella aerogenes]|uniref:PerC family transcriptional regulator n=1 Tax=Klebsiella aerogenes TaxID=548 RepID=UPI002DBCAFB5|nr:PerC family transcriptional regulator [Klebsiella aerogenes]MEB5742668.1 PerC family transcriptional regulator [Klebsiella aerogenes]HBV9912370.1 PerC family transcriptional regulator [Klebsiella aerogenes]